MNNFFKCSIKVVGFSPGKIPNINNALIIKGRDIAGQQINNVTCEIMQITRKQ